ncbi:MAG: RNA polymerase sigma factor [Bacteroidota bacterium]
MSEKELLEKASKGDINSFQTLFINFQDQLKSYLYRLTASRAEAEDIAHDTFIKAYDKLHTFQQKSSLKTWVFQIATNIALNEVKKRKRWTADVSEQAKTLVLSDPKLAASIEHINHTSDYGSYDIKEHIDTCFTCISKNLAIENQVALLLKDVYDFTVQEIMSIIHKTEGQVKYFIQTARKNMTEIFDKRCALVNKNGVCHQCSELNGWFNPKQNQEAAKIKVKMLKDTSNESKEALFEMRLQLIKAIDPLRSNGNELQEILLKCNRMAMGEIK